VEQTLCISEKITHRALSNNQQRTVSHMCVTRDCLLQHVQTTAYRPPVTHICRLITSHSLMQRKSCGWQRNSGNILISSSKNTSVTDIFPHGTKSWLNSVITLVEIYFCHVNPKYNLPSTSCIICYHAAQIFEIFHILRLLLIVHNMYWGWLPKNFHYFGFSTFISIPQRLPISISLSIVAYSISSFLASSRTSAYFTPWITCPLK
jgi:hypothetical protein